MDPRKIAFVVLVAALAITTGAPCPVSSSGAQPFVAGNHASSDAAARDAVCTPAELIDVLARAYRSMDLDLYATLFPNARQHDVEFRFVLYGPTRDNETEWGYDEEMRIHRRMFRPEAVLPGERPVPRRLWVRAIDVALVPLGPWTERFDLYRSEHNPQAPLDRHRWRATSAEYATSVTWHLVAGTTMHIEGQARFVVIEDLRKEAGEPGKLLVYQWEDLGPAAAGLARAGD